MARVIRIAVVVLLAYGAWHAGSAQWSHFAFEDAVRQVAEFAADRDDESLRTMIAAEGARLGIRIDPSRVSVNRTGDRLFLDVTYSRQVPAVPGYRYTWTFRAKVERWYVPGGRIK